MQVLNTLFRFRKPGPSSWFCRGILESHNQCLPMGAASSCNLNLILCKRSQDSLPCCVAAERYLCSLLSPPGPKEQEETSSCGKLSKDSFDSPIKVLREHTAPWRSVPQSLGRQPDTGAHTEGETMAFSVTAQMCLSQSLIANGNYLLSRSRPV